MRKLRRLIEAFVFEKHCASNIGNFEAGLQISFLCSTVKVVLSPA